jgi:hypothetical protein
MKQASQYPAKYKIIFAACLLFALPIDAQRGGKHKLVVVTTTLPTGIVGVPYSAQLVASGGKPPYRWTLAPGSLPPGLTLDPATGIISGVPTQAGTTALMTIKPASPRGN